MPGDISSSSANPYNPLGRVFSRDEMAQVTDVVERHGGKVFADEITPRSSIQGRATSPTRPPPTLPRRTR